MRSRLRKPAWWSSTRTRACKAAENSRLAPVALTKHRKARFIVMSVECYEELMDGKSSQVAVEVANMPGELGELFDKGVEEHFRGR